MERSVYTYALIKSLYDQGEDYVDSFWPFAIRVFPINLLVNSPSIQRSLREKFGLDIPLHTLTTVLQRAETRGHIEREETQYKLTTKGLAYLDTFEADKDVERRINALVGDMEKFFQERNIPLSAQQIHDVLTSFLRRNIEPLSRFLNPSISTSVMYRQEAHDASLIEYIEVAEQSKPELCKTLQDMVLGSIISVVLNAQTASQLVEMSTHPFKDCRLFLDTNFVFSILDLHEPEFNESAKELFRLLKTHGFRLRIFNFTVDEICRVINGFSREAYRYSTSVRVQSIYSALKSKGWTASRSREFITNIEDVLSRREIEIEWTKDIILDKYTRPDQQTRARIRKYKPLQDLFHQNHDLAAIDKIAEIRQRPSRKIEDTPALFLTSDNRLSAYDFIELNHKENGTVCEVILDRLLTNLLWLKYPETQLSLKTIIGAYSRDLFVKRRIWDKFYEALRELKQRGQVSDDNIATLFYHNYIEGVLKPLNDGDVGDVTPEFVLEKIEEASKLPDQEVQRKVTEKEKEFLQQLNEERVKAKEEMQSAERQWLERLQKIKGNVRNSSERIAAVASLTSSGAATVTLLVTIYSIYAQFGLAFVSFASLIVGGGGIFGVWKTMNNYLRSKLSQIIYIRRIRGTFKGLEFAEIQRAQD